jgi:hypothetical protein
MTPRGVWKLSEAVQPMEQFGGGGHRRNGRRDGGDRMRYESSGRVQRECGVGHGEVAAGDDIHVFASPARSRSVRGYWSHGGAPNRAAVGLSDAGRPARGRAAHHLTRQPDLGPGRGDPNQRGSASCCPAGRTTRRAGSPPQVASFRPPTAPTSSTSTPWPDGSPCSSPAKSSEPSCSPLWPRPRRLHVTATPGHARAGVVDPKVAQAQLSAHLITARCEGGNCSSHLVRASVAGHRLRLPDHAPRLDYLSDPHGLKQRGAERWTDPLSRPSSEERV